MNTWTDDMWILVLQLLQRKPVGVKPMFAPATVELALELHIEPQEIHRRMFMLRQPEQPSLRHLVETIGASPAKLKREAQRVRQMRGCGNEAAFYDGVEINETFEKDFRPVNEDTRLTPVMLIMILDLYFRLVPSTMVVDTPDVQELARMMKVSAQEVVDVLELYQYCDPYITHTDSRFDPLLPDCFRIWRRFDDTGDPAVLTNMASQLQAYWK